MPIKEGMVGVINVNGGTTAAALRGGAAMPGGSGEGKMTPGVAGREGDE